MCDHVDADEIAICNRRTDFGDSDICAPNEKGGTVRFIFSDTYCCKGAAHLGEITVYFPTADRDMIEAALLTHGDVHVYGNTMRGMLLKNAWWEIVA